MGRACRRAVMANCRIAQARTGHLRDSPDCADFQPSAMPGWHQAGWPDWRKKKVSRTEHATGTFRPRGPSPLTCWQSYGASERACSASYS